MTGFSFQYRVVCGGSVVDSATVAGEVISGNVSIDGAPPVVGSALTVVDNVTYTGAESSRSYRWEKLTGGTYVVVGYGSSYTPTSSDVGAPLRVGVVVVGTDGVSHAVYSSDTNAVQQAGGGGTLTVNNGPFPINVSSDMTFENECFRDVSGVMVFNIQNGASLTLRNCKFENCDFIAHSASAGDVDVSGCYFLNCNWIIRLENPNGGASRIFDNNLVRNFGLKHNAFLSYAGTPHVIQFIDVGPPAPGKRISVSGNVIDITNRPLTSTNYGGWLGGDVLNFAGCQGTASNKIEVSGNKIKGDEGRPMPGDAGGIILDGYSSGRSTRHVNIRNNRVLNTAQYPIGVSGTGNDAGSRIHVSGNICYGSVASANGLVDIGRGNYGTVSVITNNDPNGAPTHTEFANNRMAFYRPDGSFPQWFDGTENVDLGGNSFDLSAGSWVNADGGPAPVPTAADTGLLGDIVNETVGPQYFDLTQTCA